MPRAILFDFNGVLIDDEPLHFEAFRRLLAELGHELPVAAYLEDFLGRDDRSGLRAFHRRLGVPLDASRETRSLARKTAYYTELVRQHGWPFVPGAVEFVRRAAASGRMLGLVTGALRSEVIRALSAADVAGLFKVLVTAGEVERGKPDPEGYRRALDRLNSLPPLPERLLHPHEVLAIEDSPAGLAAASAAGLVTAAFTAGEYALDLEGADLVLAGFEGLALDELAARFAVADRGAAGLS